MQEAHFKTDNELRAKEEVGKYMEVYSGYSLRKEDGALVIRADDGDFLYEGKTYTDLETRLQESGRLPISDAALLEGYKRQIGFAKSNVTYAVEQAKKWSQRVALLQEKHDKLYEKRRPELKAKQTVIKTKKNTFGP